MIFGSVCSGIEAASVAFAPLGWKAAWLAEIEPFPSAVLAHHYPDVPNLGDMTKIAGRVRAGEIAAPDVLCGGTPCQAFSVAGLRESLSDERGGLTLKFVELGNAIDDIRRDRGEPEAIILWENVPGVLSTKDNAFGCFLGALAGEDAPLEPAGGKWSDAGCVFGPQRAIAWRTLDAQYFGLAQRRRRVFVVASARNGFDPAAVLFEFDGVRRDSPPSREAAQKPAAGTLRSTDGGSDVDHARGYQLIAGTLQANGKAAGSATQQDAESGLLIAHTLRGEGFDASEDGTGRGTPLVPVSYAIQAGALRTNPLSGPDGVGVQADHAYTLEARAEVQAVCHVVHGTQDPCTSTDSAFTLGRNSGQENAICFDTTQITSATNRCNPQAGDPYHPLAAVAHAPAIAFSCKDHGADVAPTMRAMGHDGSHANAGGQLAVALQDRMRGDDGRGYDRPPPVSVEQTGTLETVKPWNVVAAMQVRRLIPEECEALQGFPRGYTKIPWRKKPASECPDGPRYKALGNSWAADCVRWIGARIQAQANTNQQKAAA